MGQFKPMVKMMTTEPSVELKLKKGGKVAKKADGGMMGAPDGGLPPAMPARGGMMGAAAPMKPSLAMRRRAMKGMPAGAGPAGPVGAAASMQPSAPAMKKGGKAKHEDAAEDRAMIKKALAGKKFATGGVVNGQGGFKKGGKVKMAKGGIAGDGIIPESESASGSGPYRNTEMHTAKPDRSPAKTGGVKDGNGGGYATGGVAKANGGGYKKGGSAKKAYAAGGTVDSGRPVAMPQGRKPIPSPVAISRLAGTYKAGGKVTPAEGRMLKASAAENAASFRAAKMDTNERYGPANKLKLKEGGDVDLSKGAYDKTGKVNRDLEDALNPLSMVKELAGKAKNYFMPKGSDSVTKTKESVTVTPAKKRGGSVKC